MMVKHFTPCSILFGLAILDMMHPSEVRIAKGGFLDVMRSRVLHTRKTKRIVLESRNSIQSCKDHIFAATFFVSRSTSKMAREITQRYAMLTSDHASGKPFE
jgi:hypothetical protein